MNKLPLRVGIIGVHPDKGWAATAHLPALQRLPEYQIAAVSHHDLATARAAAHAFSVPHAFASAAELVTHPDVDLVVVAVKVPRHAELVGQAIAAGKAVFSEWPLGTSLAEAESMRDLARAAGVATSIGLQTRAAPAFAHARHLVRDGYVGRVLSASMIGSGILWGEAVNEGYVYTLDPANGAAMLNVPFAHSIDGLLHVLGAGFDAVSGLLGNARKTTRIVETGAELPLSVADQILLAGQLSNGVAVSAHFRGGLSRATNFHVEINGTHGDLLITSPVGYVGIGGMRLQGAHGDETLHEIEIPASYTAHGAEGPAQLVASAYQRLAEDIANGTHDGPDFDDAVGLHRLVDTIVRNAGVLK
ncbi:Gfo/Idh/MocA family protein [Massilia niastensis]|uniref:Gfo/Idh/MocA family protein n=1 Tax=Massilia niastensis TaxID=544911 RepID=UPI000382ACEC|nr:Gfo/Idh/MocA family oxidoreductase [Massilia niastensis]